MRYEQKILENTGIQKGQSVADFGSGRGRFSLLLAEAAGENGTVFAVDIDSRALGKLKKKIHKKSLEKNITLVLADNTSNNLADDSVDLIFSKNAFHHFTDPEGIVAGMRRALRPGGKIIVIDFKENRGIAGRLGHCSAVEKIDGALKSAGFSRVPSPDILPKQHFLVYT